MLLPFEGDPVLAVILSKAIMLADDASIEDSDITSQTWPRAARAPAPSPDEPPPVTALVGR